MTDAVTLAAYVVAYQIVAILWGVAAIRALGGYDLVGAASVGLMWPITIPLGLTMAGVRVVLRMVKS